MPKKREGDTVYLEPSELKLFNLLKKHSADPSNWASLEEIKNKLGLSSVQATKKLIKSLRRKEGIVLYSSTKNGEEAKQVTYGLSSETLEVLVRRETGKENPKPTNVVYKALYLGEPCFGTKAFDDKYTMRGLALFLEVNKHAGDLKQVIIQGGVIPHVPPYSSKSYVSDLRFLGYVAREGEKKNVSEKLLEQKLENEFEKAFYEEHVNNEKRKKITDLTDAFSAAEEALTPLMDVLSHDTVLRIQFGEEDRKNVGHIENAYIKAWAKEKKEQIKEMKSEAVEDAKELHKNSTLTILEKICLETPLKKLGKRKKEKEKDYCTRVVKHLTERIEEADSRITDFWSDFEGLPLMEIEYGDALQSVARFLYKAKKPKIKSRMKKLDKDLSEVEKQKRDLRSRLEDLSSSMSWTEDLLGGTRNVITWFTKQYPLSADGAEVAWKKAKDRYTAHFFDWNIGQPMVVHVSPRKNIKVETDIVEDVRSGKKLEAKVEYQIIHGEKKILLVSNLKFSDSVSPGDIKDAKLEMNYQNMVLKKLFKQELNGNQPDIVLLGAHTTGGFRVMPWFKDSEQFIEGEFVKGREISYLIKLPTLQSMPKLEWLVAKNFKNWHTKNYKAGPYASAAVLHSENKDGVNKFTVVDASLLVRFGEIAEEIEGYREKLKQKLPQKERKNILDLIKKKKALVKANFGKIEAAGDFHLGSPDYPGRYSKDQLIKAYHIYQREHGLPQIVSWDEILHGVEDRIFKGSSRYHGKIPEKFLQDVIEPILKRSDMPEKEKAREIAKQTMMNQRAITIHNDSEQKHLFALLLKPYAEQIISKGGQLVLTSGNHYNKSQRTGDEAIELANQFPEAYQNRKKIHVFSGKGNNFGLGTMYLPGGQKLFVMHKFPERQDEIYGIMTHLRKMNNDADIVIAGDRHQPGAGYADAHLVVEHPGFETINKYVPQIGKPPDRRGIVNIHYDPGKRGLYEVEFVLGDTLEKIVEKEDII